MRGGGGGMYNNDYNGPPNKGYYPPPPPPPPPQMMGGGQGPMRPMANPYDQPSDAQTQQVRNRSVTTLSTIFI